MTTTRTGESPTSNTPEKAAQASKSVDQKPADFSIPTNIFSEAELKEAAAEAEKRAAVHRTPTAPVKDKSHQPW